MADTTIVNPPAGTATGISKEDVQRMINDSLKPVTDGHTEIKTSLSAIAESLKARPAAEAEGDGKGKKPEALTADAVAKIVKDTLAESSKSNEAKAARDGYLGEKLKDLPRAYRDRLGSDPAKWSIEEQSLRDEYRADLKAAGAEPKQLGNATADGGTTADKQPVDRSKLSPMDLLNSDAKK